MKILIRHEGYLRNFVFLKSGDRDGSLTLVMLREGANTSGASWSTKLDVLEPKNTEFEKPRPKSKRVTIHQSGCINYHENGSKIFIEPLTRVTGAFPFYGYRIPSLLKLDLHTDEVEEDDVVLDLSDLNAEPISFSILIAPKDFSPLGRAMKLAYDAEGYSIIILIDTTPFSVPVGYEEHFTTLTPDRGPFLEQQMAEDQAMISYHQALAGSPGLIMYQPNGEGVIRLIFSVPMRIAPRFEVELVDPELHVSEQDVLRDERSNKVMLKFKVRHRRTRQIIRREVAVKSIELDSRL